MSKSDGYYSISDLANEFDVSTRTIRYYEEVGLLKPERTEKGVRTYTKGDRARLKLILRGKRFGFSLEEIKEMVELFSLDSTGVQQLETTIQYGTEKIKQIDQQIAELTALKEDIAEYKVKLESHLSIIKKSKND